MKPQTAACLQMLRAHPEGATALTALDEIGSFRLGARVFELKQEGWDVETRWETTTSGKRIAKYVLHEVDQLELAL